jgi:GNAT superfamily N-acetyltransferase
MSVQLSALADEVFGAVAAQARAGARTARTSFGEVVWNPLFPDLFFLSGIADLIAPDWKVEDLERAFLETVPKPRAIRASSRDAATIARLGPLLANAGYQHEIRIAMLYLDPAPVLAAVSRGKGIEISHVRNRNDWAAFETTVSADTAEHGWSREMTDQLVGLYRWRAEHNDHGYFLAFHDRIAVAHVGLFQHRTTAYLHGLFSVPSVRRRGIGSGLTLAMRDEAAATGCDRLCLQCVDDGYLPGYYHRIGFRPVGEQHIWTKLL